MMSSHHLLIAILAACLGAGAGCDGAGSGAETPAVDARTVADTAAAAQAAGVQGASIDLGVTLGDPDAPIHVVEFSDFGCPYCGRFARTTLPAIQGEYIEAGLVHWRYVPVVFGFPGGAMMGAAAVCAAELDGADGFWTVHDLLYTRQVALREEDARPRLLDWLAETGFDRDAMAGCMDAPETRATLQTHTAASREWFVRGTPTFVINGVPMSGAVPVDFFRKVFDTVLDPAGL